MDPNRVSQRTSGSNRITGKALGQRNEHDSAVDLKHGPNVLRSNSEDDVQCAAVYQYLPFREQADQCRVLPNTNGEWPRIRRVSIHNLTQGPVSITDAAMVP